MPVRGEEADDGRSFASLAGAATVTACYAAGLSALDGGALAEARQWAERCDQVAGAAGDARCAVLHGAVAAQTGDRAGAAAHFRRAAACAPEDTRLARQVAEALAVHGALADAAAILEKVTEHDSQDVNLLVDLCYLRMASGETSAARAVLERAAALRPVDTDVARSMAQAYEALGEAAKAVSVLSEAAERAPSPRILADLARLYLRLQRYREAEETFVALQARDPEHQVFAGHGRTWCRIKRCDWRGALDAALATTRLDRFDLTTAFLAYARDRLFGTVLQAERLEAELGERFLAELQEHDELHLGDEIASPAAPGALEERRGG